MRRERDENGFDVEDDDFDEDDDFEDDDFDEEFADDVGNDGPERCLCGGEIDDAGYCLSCGADVAGDDELDDDDEDLEDDEDADL